MKIAFPLFNRASYGRCKPLIAALHKQHDLTLILMSGITQTEHGKASDYAKTDFPSLKVVVLPTIRREENKTFMSSTVADILFGLGYNIRNNEYDLAFLFGDRFETMGAAIAFSFASIPMAHVQGGEITGNIDERVRHAVTHLSDYHFVSTSLAKEYVKRLGQSDHTILHSGCPSLDLISKNNIRRSFNPKKDKHIICMFHPHTEESEDAYEQADLILGCVKDFCGTKKLKCYLYMPNPDPGRADVYNRFQEALTENPEIFEEAHNKPPEDFLRELSKAKFIIGNSSCILREASFLGVPGVNVGDRQRFRERSMNVVDCDFDPEQIRRSMEFQSIAKRHRKSYLYGDGNAAQKIIKFLDLHPIQLKGSLNFPLLERYKKRHMGQRRFDDHKERPNNWILKGKTATGDSVQS